MLSGSGEGNFALGRDGAEVFCASNKAKFVFDAGFGVDILFLWCLSKQCGIFEDILVDIGDMGGSSTTGVNAVGGRRGSYKPRKGKNKKRKNERGVSAAQLVGMKERNETNNLLRSLCGRGSDELISVKSTEICLIRSTLTDVTNQIMETFKMLREFPVGDEFYEDARDALKLLKEQQSETKVSLDVAVSELVGLKNKPLDVDDDDSDGTEGVDDEKIDDGTIISLGEDGEDDEASASINFEADPDAADDDPTDESDDDDDDDDDRADKSQRRK